MRLELSDEGKKGYSVTKEKLILNMKHQPFVSLGEFHQWKLKPVESSSFFLHDLKDLLEHVMLNLDAGAMELLLLHQFLAGPPPAVGRQLRSSGRDEDP